MTESAAPPATALNFTERGFGVRAAVGCSDRGHTAVSQLKPGDIDWDEIFGKHGARWLHTGGIFCALSATTPDVAIEAMQAAKRYGTIVSYDLNYRPSLWKSIGGKQKRAGSEPSHCPAGRRHARERRGFLGRSWLEVSGMDEISPISKWRALSR